MGSHFNPRWFWTKQNVKDVVKATKECNKPLFHICSGISNIGDIRLDKTSINCDFDNKYTVEYQGTANVLGSMEQLPFKSGVAGSIICDPPYDYDFATKNALINELTRILQPKGKLIFIALWIPRNSSLSLLKTDIWTVGKNRPYFKIMSMFYKSTGQIEDYCKHREDADASKTGYLALSYSR